MGTPLQPRPRGDCAGPRPTIDGGKKTKTEEAGGGKDKAETPAPRGLAVGKRAQSPAAGEARIGAQGPPGSGRGAPGKLSSFHWRTLKSCLPDRDSPSPQS